jgi:hypothetical protein
MNRQLIIQVVAPLILAFGALVFSLNVHSRVERPRPDNVISCCFTTIDVSAGWPLKYSNSVEVVDFSNVDTSRGKATYHTGNIALNFLFFLIPCEVIVAGLLRVRSK